MKKITIYLFLGIVLLGCNRKGIVSGSSADPEKAAAMQKIEEIESSDKIVWLSFAEAQKLNKYKPKKIFIDIYTSWCGWCKRMDATTFKDTAIANYLNDNYYAVKMDAESSTQVTYMGEEVSYSQLAEDKFGATGYPTTVYLDEGFNILQPLPGYLEADMLNKVLHYYGEDFYKTTTWNRFQAIYTTSN